MDFIKEMRKNHYQTQKKLFKTIDSSEKFSCNENAYGFKNC